MGWAPGGRVLANWWGRAEHGRVFGAYTAAAGMASVLVFATSSFILWLGLDWRWIFRLPVLLMLVGGITYFLLVRNRREDEGFPPLEEEPVNSEVPPPPENEEEGSFSRYAAVLENRRFLLASAAIGFQSIARYGLLIWVPVHLLGPDWTQDVYGKWVSLALPLGMAAGAMVSGWLSDQIFGGNRSRPIVLFMGLAAAMSLAMYRVADDPTAMVPFLFLGGFFVYGSQSAFWALCPDLLGHRRAGTGTGIMDAFAYLFAGLGEPLIGWIIQANDDRTELVFAVVAISCLLSAILALGIRR
jgi:MFS transporter, OPA family, glycerol-3-phosphate transporter